MAFIRITSITEGAKGTKSYKGQSLQMLDYKYAKEVGLLEYSAWLHDINVGDTLIVPYKELEQIREKGKETFEFELEHPKYANQQVGSDTYPYEIVEWVSETCVKVREMDTAEPTGPMGEHCNRYISNPNNIVVTVREHKNGGLYEPNSNSCPYILAEKPYYRRDPEF